MAPKFLRSFVLITLFTFSSSVYAELIVGVAGPLSGSSLSIGEQNEIGAQVAIDVINENGGLLGENVSLVSVDDACDPAQAEAAAAQLVAQGVSFVVGHICSGASIAASKAYTDAGIIMMSPASTNPKVTEQGYTNVFRVCGRDDQQGVVAAEYMSVNFSDKNIAILHDGQAYGKGLAEITHQQLQARGLTAALVEEYAPEKTDYFEIVDKMISAAIDVAYVGGYRDDVAILVRQAEEKGADIQFIGGDALFSSEFLLVSGDAGIGTLLTFGPDVTSLPNASDVVSNFSDNYYVEPEGYTLYSYASVQAWSQAVATAGTTDTADVIAALQSGSFSTVIGELGFDDKGDVTGISNFVWFRFTQDAIVPHN